MATADVDLELRQQLREAGNLLSKPPGPVDELLHLLDQTERLLGMVDQSPSNLMQEALNSPIRALVDDRLLKHSNMDVKVSVANCICEVTRVTAPDAPYTDDEMKGFFQLLVSTFEDLWDDSSRSYNKRLSILDTVFKVKSCVIMLDLECDALILTMFDHFLKSVRDHHNEKGFLTMKNIMCLVIEESEDISNDLLNLLLDSIKIDNEGVLPVARKLGEEVIEQSANKLKPYLEKAMNLLNDSLDNYSQVLTSVINGSTNVDKHNDESALVLNKTDETKLATASNESVQVMSNEEGVNEKDEGSAGKDLKECGPSNPQENNSEKPTDSADANEVKSEVVAHASKNESPLKETEIINVGPISTAAGFIKKGIRSKKKISGQTVDSSMDVVLTKAPEEMNDTEMKFPKRARKKTLKAEEAEEAEKALSKKVKAVDLESMQRKKSGKKVDLVDLKSKEVDAVESGLKKVGGKKTDGGEAGVKKSKQGDVNMDAGVSQVEPTKQSDMKNVESDTEDKQLKQLVKKVEKSKELVKSVEDNTSNEETDSEATLVKVFDNVDEKSDSDDDDGMDVPLSSALKTASKGKRSVSKPKDSETVKYDGSLINQKVKVWWPDDKMYYEGVVESFDATENKHKILYLDGEEEILTLKNEKWEIIQEYSVQYENAVQIEAQDTDDDDVPESPVKKKAKKTSGQSAQRSVKKNVKKPSDRRFVLGMGSKSEGGNKGKSKVGNKSKAVVNSNEQKSPAVTKTSQEPHKIVYKSKGRKKDSKAAAAVKVEPEPNDDANESSELKLDLNEPKDEDAVEEQVNVVEKSTGTSKTGSMSGQKRKMT